MTSTSSTTMAIHTPRLVFPERQDTATFSLDGFNFAEPAVLPS